MTSTTAPTGESTTGSTNQEILTGTETIARLMIEQAKADRRRGLNTGGFASGYPGSPVARIHDLFQEQKEQLAELNVHHAIGLNEELAATAVWGSQTVDGSPGANVAGVFGLWYGKAPGVDRAGDAIRHGNYRGTAAFGGVLVVAGDDPKPNATVFPSDSSLAFRAFGMPVLYPGNMQDVLDLGLHGYEMSRKSGLWIGLKLVTDVADGSGTVDLSPERFDPVTAEVEMDGKPFAPTIRINEAGALMKPAERDMHLGRLKLAAEYIRVNHLNPVMSGRDRATVGIAAAGKSYYDLREALDEIGLTDDALDEHGIRVKKVAALYPISEQEWTEFADGLTEIIVVEEKRPLIEDQLKSMFYGRAGAPAIVGKQDVEGADFLPIYGELDSGMLADVVGARLETVHGVPITRTAPTPEPGARSLLPMATARTGFFCSGCPHNTSLNTPQDAEVGAGIGCHLLGLFVARPEYGQIRGYTQMGGEGAQWIGMAPFTDTDHLFQNVGDGTFHHSASLALRMAVANKVNITYKLLYNGTVGMTGGQDVTGGMSVPALVQHLKAEGVKKIAITTEDPSRYYDVKLPRDVKVYDRTEIVRIQDELRQIPGITVLIHDQECASERRRNWRRTGTTPTTRVLINSRVCEGCGDCNRKSQCLSVRPLETELGRKTEIHQSSCNLDFSCVQGDCPSFVTVDISNAVKPAVTADDAPAVPDPAFLYSPDEFTVHMVGIGGTGVVSVSNTVATAAAIEGKEVRTLDLTGGTIKAGPVTSQIHVQSSGEPPTSKIEPGGADLFLAYDLLTCMTEENLAPAAPERTLLVASSSMTPTAAMAIDPTIDYPSVQTMRTQIDPLTRSDLNAYIDIERVAKAIFGNHMAGNALLLGVAYQKGGLPLQASSIEQAIEDEGVAVKQNIAAFRWGRAVAHDPDLLARLSGDASAIPVGTTDATRKLVESVGAGGELRRMLEIRVPDLADYQSERYAARYARGVRSAMRFDAAHSVSDDRFARTVAQYLHRLMAYKDEYEVARLHLLDSSQEAIEAEFGTGAKVSWNLHPPMLKALGMDKKIRLGEWFRPAFTALRSARRVRGTPVDPFGRTRMRRLERELAAHYADLVSEIVAHADSISPDLALELAEAVDVVRGYEDVKLTNVRRYLQTMEELCGRAGIAVPRRAELTALSAEETTHD